MNRDRRVLALTRVTLAAIAAVDLLSFPVFIAAAREAALARGGPAPLPLELASHPAALVAVAAAGVAGTLAFARRAGRIGGAALALGALALLSTVHAQWFGSPWRHLYFSGLCLAGWLLGVAVARRAGRAEDESYAWTGAAALLGAAYLNGGISKLVYGGTDWLSGLPIQALVIEQDGMVRDGLRSTYRYWLVESPDALAVFSSLTVLVELIGPLLIAGRRLRHAAAFGLVAMHANIYVLTDIVYWEATLLLLLFGFAPYTPPAVADSAAPRRAAGDRAFFATAAALALLAVLAVARQGRHHAPAQDVPPAAPAAPAAAAPTTVPPTAGPIGPFAVGQALASGWTIADLQAAGDGITLLATGAPGRVRFELTCADSPHRSPFDLGPLHIFHSNDLPFAAIEDAGAALRGRVREAAATDDPCAQLARWRAAAAAGPRR